MTKASRKSASRDARRKRYSSQGFFQHSVTLSYQKFTGANNRLGTKGTPDGPPVVLVLPNVLVENLENKHLGLTENFIGNTSVIEMGDLLISNITRNPDYRDLINNKLTDWIIAGPIFNGIYTREEGRVIEHSPLSEAIWVRKKKNE